MDRAGDSPKRKNLRKKCGHCSPSGLVKREKNFPLADVDCWCQAHQQHLLFRL